MSCNHPDIIVHWNGANVLPFKGSRPADRNEDALPSGNGQVQVPHSETPGSNCTVPLRLSSYWSLSLLLEGSSTLPVEVWFLSIQQGQEVSLGRGYNQYWLFLKVPSSMRNHHGGVGGVVRICSIEKLVLLVGWKSRGIITSAAVQQLHLKPDKVSGVIARIRWSFRLDQQDQNDQWHPVGHVCQPPGHRPLPPGGPLPLHSGGQDHYYWFNFFHAFRSTTSQTMSNFNVWGYLAR